MPVESLFVYHMTLYVLHSVEAAKVVHEFLARAAEHTREGPFQYYVVRGKRASWRAQARSIVGGAQVRRVGPWYARATRLGSGDDGGPGDELLGLYLRARG